MGLEQVAGHVATCPICGGSSSPNVEQGDAVDWLASHLASDHPPVDHVEPQPLHVAVCDEHDCEWRSNPAASAADAKKSLADHKAWHKQRLREIAEAEAEAAAAREG